MKRVFTLLLATVMSLCVFAMFFACKDKDDKIIIKVWAPAEDEFLIGLYADEFMAIAQEKYPDYTIDITYKTMAEPDVGNAVITDVQTAADVFIFPDDQILDLNGAGALREVVLNKEDIVNRNTEASVNAATVGGKMIAYPMTGDNTYYLIYDKRYVSDTQAQTMDGVLDACKTAGKQMFMDISNGWYIASFFFGNGCSLGLTEDGKTVTCDFNNDNGLRAAEGIKRITDHSAITTGDDNTIKASTNFGAIITGSWNLKDIYGKYGKENIKLAKLPTFSVPTVSGGTTYEQKQMTSFGGHKLVGVNRYSNAGNIASDFADFMTSEKGQEMRFDERQNAPTNKNIAALPKVAQNEIVKVILEQFQFTRPQSTVKSTYWGPSETFGTVLESKDLGGKSLQELLNTMVNSITTAP